MQRVRSERLSKVNSAGVRPGARANELIDVTLGVQNHVARRSNDATSKVGKIIQSKFRSQQNTCQTTEVNLSATGCFLYNFHGVLPAHNDGTA